MEESVAKIPQRRLQFYPANVFLKVGFLPTPVCFLPIAQMRPRIYTDEVLISILRPLHRDTVFQGTSTAKDLCIEYSDRDTRTIELYAQQFSLKNYSCMVCCGVYNTALTVTSYLDDVKTHHIFARACRILRWIASDFPMARYILQGIKAMAWSLEVPIPSGATSFLEELGAGKDELRDVPLAFALPQSGTMRKLLADEGDDSSQMGVEMGLLLSKWSTLSID